MNTKSIALMIYGEEIKDMDAFGEDRKALAELLVKNGFTVKPIFYHDSRREQIETKLSEFNAVQVWVNPFSQGNDRRHLDALLLNIASKGVYVSTHPEVISKIGTKKVLYTTREMEWGGDIKLYSDYNDFEKRFLASMNNTSIRVLKKLKGQSGDGIYKVSLADSGNIRVLPANSPADERMLSREDFHKEFYEYFESGGLLIDQPWSKGIINGMVRCYLTKNKVSGFGYQEAIALCPYTNELNSEIRPTSRRFYFSEYCGLFQDLRQIMESKWIPQLQEIHSIFDEMMPLLWDIDLFINDVNNAHTENKYSICEINVSSVSPFPQSCIPHIVAELNKQLKN
jgi:hypothetical protein